MPALRGDLKGLQAVDAPREGSGPASAGTAAGRAGRRACRRVLVACALVAMAVAFVLGAARAGWWPEALRAPLRAAAGPDGLWVVAVVGIDGQAGDAGRTDTILVASLDVNTGRAGLLSIPRDTAVRVGGRGLGRINTVYASAGPQALRAVLSDLLGVPVDGLARVDFNGFVRIVDALGGVVLTVERPLHYVDRAQGLFIDIPAGRQRLNGERALQYVRFRADGLGDVSVDPATGEYTGRLKRQHRFLQALQEALRGPAVLWRLPRMLLAARDAVDADVPRSAVACAAAWIALRGAKDVELGILPGLPGRVGKASYWVAADRARVGTATARVLGAVRGAVPVAVLNANGTAGSAARVAHRLSREGIEVTAVGNAPTFSLARTRVVAASREHRAMAHRIAELLGVGRGQVVVAEPFDPPGYSGVGVTVWVGRDLGEL